LARVEGEPIEEEIIKKLMELRSYLETKIAELETETEKLRSLFQIIDEVIITKSFQRAEVVVQAPPPKALKPPVEQVPPVIRGEERPLKTAAGVPLANLYVSEDELRIVPAENVTFTTTTMPFQAFLIRRILEPMQLKDKEDAKTGAMTPDRVLSFDVVTDGDLIKEIIIRNYGDQRRLREIMTSARWTFEKMYEKGLVST